MKNNQEGGGGRKSIFL